ncbi:MAG: ABC transporter ATP-binding protein [Halapricum sp.]
MASVELRDLRKEYDRGTIVAVDDLNIEIEDGEFITVVGPSGCGKTTTLRMVAGLEQPTSGSVIIGDEDVTDLHAKNRDIAMVFQNYALYPHKTVLANMEFGLRMSTDLSKEERREKVQWAAEMMGIENLLEDKPDELSGGQKQRVALGRAIVREPEVFLFDEPLSNLDAKLRKTMRTEVQRLQDELGITSIYVTHDQEEAMTMGDRILILRDGVKQQAGAPKEVYNNPINEFVGGFIGSPSMNFVDVVVEQTDSGMVLAGTEDEFRYHLSPEVVDRFGVLESGGEYVLGIRPEDVFPADGTETDTISALVEVVEPIGSDNYVYLDLSGELDTGISAENGEEIDFIARTESAFEPGTGDEVEVTFSDEDVHLFDPQTGASVLYEQGQTGGVTQADSAIGDDESTVADD